MRRHLWFCVVLSLCAACAAPLSQAPPAGTPAQVAASELRVGDTWRYAVRDGYTNLPRETVEYRVTRIEGGVVHVEVRTGERVSTELYTRSGNWITRPATNMQVFSYNPPYDALSFPLAAGKTWQSRSTATDPADGRRFPVTINGTVLGWERIRVPAGEFDALKVRRRVFLDYWQQNVRGQSIIEEYDWYAPALKQVAKRQTSSEYLSYLYGRSAPRIVAVRDGGRDDGGPPSYVRDDVLVYELVSYTVR